MAKNNKGKLFYRSDSSKSPWERAKFYSWGSSVSAVVSFFIVSFLRFSVWD